MSPSYVWLLLVSCVAVAHAFEITSQETTTQNINGLSRYVHTATVLCSEGDDGTPRVIKLTDAGGTTRTVTFTCSTPTYVYDNAMVGWVPRVQIPVFGKVCLVNNPSNTSGVKVDGTASGEMSTATRRLLFAGDNLPDNLLNEDRHWDTQGLASWLGYVKKGAGEDSVAEGTAKAGVGMGLKGFIVGGLVAGVTNALFCHYVFHSCGGGSGGVKALFKQVYKTIGRVEDTVSTLVAWSQNQKRWDLNADAEWAGQQDINNQLENQIQDNTNSINILNTDVQSLANVTEQIETELVKGFSTVGSQIAANGNFSEEIWDAVRFLHNQTDSRLRQLFGQLANTNRQIRDLDITLLQRFKQTTMRRSITQLFWSTLDLATPQPTVPFLNYTGTRPLTLEARLALSTLEGSRRISSVIIERTVLKSATYWAQWYNFSYICDQDFLLANAVPTMSFQALFDFLGPGGCYPGTSSASWACQCAIVVEWHECELLNVAASFPWTWVHTHTLLAQGATNSKCYGVVQKHTIANTAAVVLTDIASAFAYIGAFCADSTVLAVGGKKVRMSAVPWPTHVDLSLSTGVAGADVCNANFIRSFTPGAPVHLYFSYNLYTLWTNAYNLGFVTVIPEMEEINYGRIASGLSYTEMPFNNNVERDQTYECKTFTYIKTGTPTGTGSEKLPMYSALTSSILKSMAVEVDGITIQGNIVENTTSQQSFRSVALPSLNQTGFVTMTTDVILDNDAINVLPAQFYRFGKWRSFEVGEDPLATWDIPFDQISSSRQPNARQGMVNYLWKLPQKATSLLEDFSLTDWEQTYATWFDANQIGTSPVVYKRFMRAISGNRFVCASQSGVNGTGHVPLSTEFEWCSLLRHYDVATLGGAAQTQMTFKPHRWTMSGTLTVPGGAAVETSLSICPSDIDVIVAGGSVTIIMNTTAAEIVNLLITVSNPQRAPDCVIMSAVRSMTAFSPLTLGPFNGVDGCQTLRLQATPIGSATGCFKNGGIVLRTSHQIQGGPGSPAVVEHAIADVEDRTVDDLIRQMHAESSYVLALEQLQHEDLSDSQIVDRVNAIEEQRIKSIQSMKLPGKRQAEEIAKAIARIHNSSTSITNNIKKNHQDAASVHVLNAKLNRTLEQQRKIMRIIAGQEILLEDEDALTKASQAKLLKAIDAYHSSSSCSLGPLCSVLDGLKNLIPDGLKGLFSMLLHGLIYIGLLLLGLYLVYILVKACMSRLGKKVAGSSGKSAGRFEAEVKHELRALARAAEREIVDGSTGGDDTDEEESDGSRPRTRLRPRMSGRIPTSPEPANAWTELSTRPPGSTEWGSMRDAERARVSRFS